MEFHEAANIFPLNEESLDELAKDIKTNGQQVAIELLDGKIIDGRRRFKACGKAGVKPWMRDVTVDDPIAYVLSLNLHRRHLTPSQVAMVGGRARDLYDEQAKERKKEGQDRGRKAQQGLVVNVPPTNHEKARDAVGKVVGVSGSLIDRATKVLDKGVPELAKAVDEGRLSVSAAAKLADQPEETQKQVADAATFQGGRYRKQHPETNGHADPDTDPAARNSKSKAIALANEAINCLIRIPKSDHLRKRGFQIVTDWIKANK